jgi:hypothetical protein
MAFDWSGCQAFLGGRGGGVSGGAKQVEFGGPVMPIRGTPGAQSGLRPQLHALGQQAASRPRDSGLWRPRSAAARGD